MSTWSAWKERWNPHTPTGGARIYGLILGMWVGLMLALAFVGAWIGVALMAAGWIGLLAFGRWGSA